MTVISTIRAAARFGILVLVAISLSGCHIHGHGWYKTPPGQVKKQSTPAGGAPPPGQAKKY